MFRQLITIARNTFTESVRQPIFVVLLITGTLFMWIMPYLSAYTFEDDNKILIDMSLSTLLIAGMVIAAFTATRVLTAEIENKTVLTVISKPVSRPIFVVGKFLGVASALFVAHWILTSDMLLMMRHRVMTTAGDHFDGPVWTFGFLAFAGSLIGAALANYYYNWIFNSTFVFSYLISNTVAWLLVLVISKDWAFQSPVTEFLTNDGRPIQVLIATLLTLEATTIAVSVAIAVSTRLGQVMTIVVCAVVYLVGIVSDTLYHEFALGKTLASMNGFWDGVWWLLANGAYRLTPNFAFLHLADDLSQGHVITGQYVLWASFYTLVFIAAALTLAVGLFQNRQVS